MDDLKLEALIEDCEATLYGTELVKENGKDIYRIYIFKKGGVTLELCSKITQIISPIIDLNPPVNGPYFLEVSSPGLERKIKTLKQFELSIGELVDIKSDVQNCKGELLRVEDENIVVKDSDLEIVIPFAAINRAKTYIKW
jgi:ribosome maturation factor RimP